MGEKSRLRYRREDQTPPEPRRVSKVVVERLEHILEVDPELMGNHFKQQRMPVWDSQRIADARWDHLDDVHGQFADSVLVAGEESETVKESEH
jgi:hypothetical protein